MSRRIECVHITHNDADAVGCALVASLYYGMENVNTYFCATNAADAKLTELMVDWETEGGYPYNIMISDISISKEMASTLEDKAEEYGFNIISVDHHPTNPNIGKGWLTFVNKHNFGMVEDTISAAMGLWIKLFGDADDILRDEYYDISTSDLHDGLFEKYCDILGVIALRKLILYISRYDTWMWKKNPLAIMYEDTIALMTKLYGPEYVYTTLHDYYISDIEAYLNDVYTENLDDTGDIEVIFNRSVYPKKFRMYYDFIKEMESKYTSTKYIESNVKVFIDGEYQFASFICDHDYTNATADTIYTHYPEIDIVLILYPTTRTLSFRSNKTTVDLGRFAKRIFGGGGHAQASGAHVDTEVFINFLMKHYNAEPITSLSSEN